MFHNLIDCDIGRISEIALNLFMKWIPETQPVSYLKLANWIWKQFVNARD